MSTEDPERLLSQALRAQAVMGGSGLPAAEDAALRERGRHTRPVAWWLLIVVLGLVAGALAGVVSLI